MIAWKEWGPAAFAEARQAKIPVLLLLSSGRTPKELELAFVGLDGLLQGRCVPICADRCDRPDVFDRYSGDKPVALLSDDGRILERFALDGVILSTALKARLESFQPPALPLESQGKEVWTGAVGGGRRAALHAGRPRAIVSELVACEGPLSIEAVDLLLYAAAEWKDGPAAKRAELEINALVARLGKNGELLSIEVPILGTHARLARLIWDAYALMPRPEWREAALAVCGFMARELFDPQRRGFRHHPGVASIHADENAQAVLAFQRAAAFEPDLRFGQTAADALAMLQSTLFDPMLGMLHRRDEGGTIVYGLLADTAWTILAFTDAFQATGHKPHREFADDLARFLFQELWDREGGAFLDRLAQKDDIGLLKTPRLAAPEQNAAALEGLWRLHHLKGNFNYKRWLEWGLARLADVPGQPAAALARVQDMLGRGRLDLELIGRPGDPEAEALVRAVDRQYAPRRIVSFVDPDDQDYIMAHRLETPGFPRLYGCVDLRPVSSTLEPEKVGEVLRALSDRTT